MLFNHVEKNLEKYKMLPTSGSIVLAVSGGVDSTVMAQILTTIALKNGLKPVICHLNHMFRGDESCRDAKFVKSLAFDFGVPSEIKQVNMPDIIKSAKGGSPQNLSRIHRRMFFKEVAKIHQAETIFTAHNLDDVCETFFMRLFRGSGALGLKSITPTSMFDELRLCRPLIDVSRAEIEKYSKENEVEFVEDSSNRSDKYDRNKLRLNIIPAIKKEFNPNLTGTIKMVTDLIGEDDDYFSSVVTKELEQLISTQDENSISIRLSKFNSLHVALKTRIVRSLIKRFKGDLHDISYINVMDVLHISESNEPKKEIFLPMGLKAMKINSILKISY